MTTRRLAITAGISAYATALTIAGIATFTNGLNDAHDYRLFGLWSLPLALMSAWSAPPISQMLRPRSLGARIAGVAVLGLCIGMLWTLVAAVLIGGWIANFGFAVAPCWIAGAVAGSSVPVCASIPRPISAVPPALTGRVLRQLLARVLAVSAAATAVVVGLWFGSVWIWDRAAPEVHLLPAGYRGPVIIVFDRADGIAPSYEGKARLYRIPTDGVLRTRFAPNEGWSNATYFYVDERGGRTPIVAGSPCDVARADDPVQACLSAEFVWSSAGGARISPSYDAYVIGRHAERSIFRERGDSLVHALFVPSIP